MMDSQPYFSNERGGRHLSMEAANNLFPQVRSGSLSRGTSPGIAATLSGAPSSSNLLAPRSGSISSHRRRSLPNPGPELVLQNSGDENYHGGLVSQAPPSEDFIHEILAINTLAMQRTKVESLAEAMEMLTEVYDKLSKEDTENVVGDLQMLDQLRATTLNNMGVTECRRGQPRKALSHFEGARQLEEKWNIASPSVVLNTCAAYNTLQIYDKATSAALETIEMLRTLELQKKWARKRGKDGEKDLRTGLGFLRDISCAPSTVSSKIQGGAVGKYTGFGRRKVSPRSPSKIPRTSAERKAAKEEEAMLNAAAFPTIAPSENAALWGAAWHNLGVAQLNLAQQAKDQSEYSNALSILENAMRTTYDKLGTKHPMSMDVTETFRSVRHVLLKNGAYKPHRTMKHAVLPPVDPRVQLLENLKVEAEEGESHARALENQRKNLSITFRGEVTKGKKFVERLDPTPYPGGGYEPFQQRHHRPCQREDHSHRRGRRSLHRNPLDDAVSSALPFSPTLIAATKIYGNPHPLLEAGVGANALAPIHETEYRRGDEKQSSGGASDGRHKRSKRKGKGRDGHRKSPSFRMRNGLDTSGRMRTGRSVSCDSHELHRGGDGQRGRMMRSSGSRGRNGRGGGGGGGSGGDPTRYTFLSPCVDRRSHSLPLSHTDHVLSEEEEQKEQRKRTTEGARESGGRRMMMMTGGSGGGASGQGVSVEGQERAGYPSRAVEQFYGSEIPKMSKGMPSRAESGPTCHQSPEHPMAAYSTHPGGKLETQERVSANRRKAPPPSSIPPTKQLQVTMPYGAALPPAGYPSYSSGPPLPSIPSSSLPPQGVPPHRDINGGRGVNNRCGGASPYASAETLLLPPLSPPEQQLTQPASVRGALSPKEGGHPSRPHQGREVQQHVGEVRAAQYCGLSASSIEAYREHKDETGRTLHEMRQIPSSHPISHDGALLSHPPPPIPPQVGSSGFTNSSTGGGGREVEMWTQSKLLLLSEPSAFPLSNNGNVPIQYHHVNLETTSALPLTSEALSANGNVGGNTGGGPGAFVAPPSPLPQNTGAIGKRNLMREGENTVPQKRSSSQNIQRHPQPLERFDEVSPMRVGEEEGRSGHIPPSHPASDSALTVGLAMPCDGHSAPHHESILSSYPEHTISGGDIRTPHPHMQGGAQSTDLSPPPPSHEGMMNFVIDGGAAGSRPWSGAPGGPNEVFGAMWVVADPRLLPKSQSGALNKLSCHEGNSADVLMCPLYDGSVPKVLEINENGAVAPDATCTSEKRVVEPIVRTKAALMLYSDEDGGRSDSTSTETLSQPFSGPQ